MTNIGIQPAVATRTCFCGLVPKKGKKTEKGKTDEKSEMKLADNFRLSPAVLLRCQSYWTNAEKSTLGVFAAIYLCQTRFE